MTKRLKGFIVSLYYLSFSSDMLAVKGLSEQRAYPSPADQRRSVQLASHRERSADDEGSF